MRPPTPGLFLCNFDKKPLISYQFSAILAKTLGYRKIPQATFKSHSFRIGAATAACLNMKYKLGDGGSQCVIKTI